MWLGKIFCYRSIGNKIIKKDGDLFVLSFSLDNFQAIEWQKLPFEDFNEETFVVGTWNDKVGFFRKILKNFTRFQIADNRRDNNRMSFTRTCIKKKGQWLM